MGFIVGLIAPAFAATAIGAAVSSAINIGAAAGLTFAASKLAPRKRGQGSVGGLQTQLQVDTNVPQSLVVGRSVVAGSLAYADTFGTYGRRGSQEFRQNTYLGQAIVLADHPIDGIEEVWVNGERRTWTGDIGAEAEFPAFGSRYGSLIKASFKDGRQTVADAFLVHNLQSSENPWGPNAVGRGVAYVRTFATYYRDVVNNIPDFKFVVRGARLYDPRFDSSVGGSGPQRWDDLNTHTFTENLAVIAYNVLRGIRVQSEKGPVHFYGLENTTADRLPLANWFAAMNECDRLVPGPNGLEPQFHGGGEIPVSTKPIDALKAILTASDARLVEVGGTYKIYVGAPGAPVLSVTDDDLLATNEDTYDLIRGLEDRANYITASYISRETWERTDAPALESPTFEAEDGRRIPTALDLDFVQSASHAQRLMSALLKEQRRQRRHSIPLPPYALVVEPGDVIAWTSQRNGYQNKLFVVESRSIASNLDVTLVILEVDPADYDWHPDTDWRAPADGRFLTFPPTPRGLVGLDAEGYVWRGDGGQQRPAILLTWNPADPDVDAVLFELRRKVDVGQESEPTVHDQSNEPASGSFILLRDLQRFTWYQVRARPIGANGWASEWGLWIDVLTPNVGLVDLADLGAELRDKVVKVDKFDDQIASVALAQLNADQQRATLEKELAVEARKRAAADAASAVERAVGLIGQLSDEARLRDGITRQASTFKTLIDQATGAVGANFTDTIAAAKADALAAIDQESQVRASKDDALSSRIDTVSASIQGFANASAVQAIRAEVDALDGTVAAHTSAITSIAATLPGLASSSGLQSLDTRVTYTEQSIEAQSRAIEQINADISGRATVSALTALSGTVAQQGNTISAQGQAIQQINVDLAGKASLAAWSSLSGTVSQQGDTIAAQGQAIQQINIQLGDKASTTALNSLSGKVTQQGNTLTAQGQTLIGLQSQVSDRVTSSAFQTFQTSVSSSLDAQASALTQVQVRAGEATADGRLSFDVTAGAGGAKSRARLRVRTDVNGTWKQAGLYFEAGSGSEPAYAVVESDRLVIMNSAGTATALFDNSGRIPGAWITRITTDQIVAGTAQFDSAFIKNASITNAHIRNLEVDTLKLAYNSVNEINYVSGPASINGIGVLRALTVQNPDAYPCLVAFSGYGSGSVSASAGDNPSISLKINGKRRLLYVHTPHGEGALFKYSSSVVFGQMMILPALGPSFQITVETEAFWRALWLDDVSIYVARIKR